MTIKITDLKLEYLNFEEVKVGNNNTFVKPTYEHEDFPCLQFPWLTLSSFGVPQKGQYTKEDKQRMFIKVPIEMGDLYSQLMNIDEKMRKNIIDLSNLHIFGSSLTYEYEPLLKYDVKQNITYIKVKLDTSYPDDKILTEVWHLGDDTKGLCQIDNIDAFAKCVPFKSEIRMLIKVSKLWVVNKKYGLTITLKKIQVKPRVRQSQEVNFIDDD